jgi:hypothetical protein
MVAFGLLAACAAVNVSEPTDGSVAGSTTAPSDVVGTPLVADVIDFALTSNEWQAEDEIHSARDGGELDEFPGTPDTKGRYSRSIAPFL